MQWQSACAWTLCAPVLCLLFVSPSLWKVVVLVEAEEVLGVELPAVIEPPAHSAQAAILCPAPASHLPAARSPLCLSLQTHQTSEVEATLLANVVYLYI